MKRDLILIIEDESDIAELLRYNLERRGFEVTVTSTGEEGLRAAEFDPALILLDLGLPGISGREVCRTLMGQKETREIPVLLLTARGYDLDVATCLELGADDYIAKPFELKELMARVRSYLA